MSREEKMSTGEKWRLWWRQIRPWKDEEELSKSMYKWDPVGPYSLYWRGAPHYYLHKALFILGGFAGIFAYSLTKRCGSGDIVMSLELLNQINALCYLLLAVGIFFIMFMFVDGHKGTFGHYKIQVEPCAIRDLLTEIIIDTILRVKDAWEIWPPTGKVSKYFNEHKALVDAIAADDEAEAGGPEVE